MTLDTSSRSLSLSLLTCRLRVTPPGAVQRAKENANYAGPAHNGAEIKWHKQVNVNLGQDDLVQRAFSPFPCGLCTRPKSPTDLSSRLYH